MPPGCRTRNDYSTARDLAKVTEATIREFPDYYAWYGIKEYLYNNIKQHNRNRLLWRDDAVDGVKTGHTKDAGYCLVASAKRDGMRLTSVILGTESEEARAKASLALLNYGFRAFEGHHLYDQGQPLENLRIWMGEVTELPVGPDQEVYATIPRGSYDKLSAHIQKNPDLIAPVAKGDRVGDIVVSLGDKEISRQPLVALRDVAEGGLWAKIRDTVLRWFSWAEKTCCPPRCRKTPCWNSPAPSPSRPWGGRMRTSPRWWWRSSAATPGARRDPGDPAPE